MLFPQELFMTDSKNQRWLRHTAKQCGIFKSVFQKAQIYIPPKAKKAEAWGENKTNTADQGNTVSNKRTDKGMQDT